MKAVTTSIFGPVHLRLLGPRSSILDFWLAELRPDQDSGDATGLPCMIRRMLPPYAFAPDLMRAYVERTREVMGFAHPAVLLPLTVQNEQGTIYTLFEACSGWNLAERLVDWQERQVVLPLDGILQLFFPLAHALACAHARPEKPLVHGAIRPVSIWIEADGRPKLCDFDVGPLAEFDLRGSSVFEATGMRALAPERDKDWANPPVGTDSFSFAATLLEVLAAGRLSRVQNSAVLRDRLTLLMTQGVSPEVLRLLAACHADDPQERPAMKGVAEALKDMLGRVPRTQRFSEFLTAHSPPPPVLAGQAVPHRLARHVERLPRLELEPDTKGQVEAVATVAQDAGGGGGGLRLLLVLGVVLALAGAGIHLAMPGLIPGLLGNSGSSGRVSLDALPEAAAEGQDAGSASQEEDRSEHSNSSPKSGRKQGGTTQAGTRSDEGEDTGASRRRPDGGGASENPSARAPKDSAGLIVASTQVARLQIDDKPYGTTSAERVIRLTPGAHRIRIEDATFAEPVVLEASLPSGETSIFEYDAARGTWKMGSRPDPESSTEGSPAP